MWTAGFTIVAVLMCFCRGENLQKSVELLDGHLPREGVLLVAGEMAGKFAAFSGNVTVQRAEK